MKSTKYSVLVFLVAFAMIIAGCGSTGQSPQEPSSEQSQVSPPSNQQMQNTEGQGSTRITVYFATHDAMFLAPEVHTVAKNDHPAKTSIELLLKGPSKQGLVSTVPQGTQLRGLTIKNHIAYVDFNDKIIKNNTGGSTAEILLVASIVNTLTEFPDIEKVQILVEGKKVETISGHMDVSEPLSRSEKIIKK